jgi:hypothetical protein
MKKFVLMLAVLATGLVADLSATENSNARFNAIRAYVMRVDASQFGAFLAEEKETLGKLVKISSKSSVQRVVDEIATELGKYAPRKVSVVLYKHSSKIFRAEAVSLYDTVYVSEAFVSRLLDSPQGIEVLRAVIAHEMSHGSRDFLVKRGIENDKTLSDEEKAELHEKLELQSDLGGIDLLARAGYNPRGVVTMLVGFEEARRLQEAEKLVATFVASGASQ